MSAITKLAYELVPSSDEQMSEIDKMIEEL